LPRKCGESLDILPPNNSSPKARHVHPSSFIPARSRSSQSAAFFHGHIAYDDIYTGAADALEEGERLYFEAMMRVVDRALPGYAD
jgi:hypothetical protein